MTENTSLRFSRIYRDTSILLSSPLIQDPAIPSYVKDALKYISTRTRDFSQNFNFDSSDLDLAHFDLPQIRDRFIKVAKYVRNANYLYNNGGRSNLSDSAFDELFKYVKITNKHLKHATISVSIAGYLNCLIILI